MTSYPHRVHVHRLHINGWLVAVVALAAALVALGSWVLVDHYSGGGSSSQNATTLIDNMNAAVSSGNANATVGLYSKNAVIWAEGSRFATGSKAIHAAVLDAKLSQYRQERIAPVTVAGDYAATFDKMSLDPVPALDVVQIKNGKIYREWLFDLGQTKPFDNADLTLLP